MKTRLISIGKWGLYEKHFQSLISKVKKVYFYLHVLNKFYLTF